MRDEVVQRYFDAEEKTLTFNELIELHFVRIFRDAGVRLSVIRRCHERAAKKFHSERPFLVKGFKTDGKTIFLDALREDGEATLEDLDGGQFVFRDVLAPFFKKLEYKVEVDGTATVGRFWPLEKAGRVVLDPHRKFGKPIIDEFAMPTSVIYDAVHAGKNGQEPEVVARWLKISIEAVWAAVRFEESLVTPKAA